MIAIGVIDQMIAITPIAIIRVFPMPPPGANNVAEGWNTLQQELYLFRAWLWLAITIDVMSSFMYLAVPSGTVAHFGGTDSPSAAFWCSTAATGDAVSAYWCFTALRANKAPQLRDAARGLMLFTIVHLGAFARAHYLLEPHPGGGTGYVLSIIVGVIFGIRYGFFFPFEKALAGGPAWDKLQEERTVAGIPALAAERVRTRKPTASTSLRAAKGEPATHPAAGPAPPTADEW